MFALTAAISKDSGRHWSHLHPPPQHLVAAVPYPYDGSHLWFGWGDTAGILQSPRDGYYYTIAHNRATINLQVNGSCLMRTKDLYDVKSWRGWNGSEFSVSFSNPYEPATGDTFQHVCQVLEGGEQGLPRGQHSHPMVVQGLVWSSFLRKHIAVLWNTGHDPTVCGGAPFLFALSDDLLTWSEAAALPMPPGLPNGTKSGQYPIQVHQFTPVFGLHITTCGIMVLLLGAGSLAYPSLLDPSSTSRNFDVVGQTPSLYFGLANPAGTSLRNHWDALVRVPLDFGNWVN